MRGSVVLFREAFLEQGYVLAMNELFQIGLLLLAALGERFMNQSAPMSFEVGGPYCSESKDLTMVSASGIVISYLPCFV